VGYSNAYASARAEDSICGFDYRHFKDGKAASMPTAARHKLFGLSSGMPNTAGLNLAYNGKPIPRSDSEPLDPHFNGLLCLREYYRSNATQSGVNALAHSGDLHNTPTIIIQGEHDALVIANHNARGYLAWRQHKLPARNNLRYYEIARAQHFDALLGLAEFSADFIPLHHYYEQALELMWQHLETGAPLPPHQWVATKAATPLKASDLPPIQAKPGALAIRVNENSVNIPN
ncbi:MAG: D-(-)-3-hydroxybutyrate oligomer hydrolase, partial [Cellvibrionaceae bacterium]|nr:D-(-)-3-hydroxybutyrate oligomer hydrolase [Cellvibrionaceae bacterium]